MTRVPSPGQGAILRKLIMGPLRSTMVATDGKSAVSLYECLREGWCEEVPYSPKRPGKLLQLTEHGAAFVVKRK